MGLFEVLGLGLGLLEGLGLGLAAGDFSGPGVLTAAAPFPALLEVLPCTSWPRCTITR